MVGGRDAKNCEQDQEMGIHIMGDSTRIQGFLKVNHG